MRSSIRLSIVALAAVMALLASATPARGVAGFGDVGAGRFYSEPVQWMVDEAITTGTSATCFSPDDDVTRGQAAAFMWRMEGSPKGSPPHPFTDIVSSWQQDAVSWMAHNDITTGTSPSEYSPDDPLTRGELAALLHRLAGLPPAPAPDQFSDVVTPWQITPVGWLLDQKITTGTSATAFSPDENVTRGQLATFFYRYKGSPKVVIDPDHPYCASRGGLPPAGEAIGFGGNATGGSAPCVVTTLADSGSGSLRACAEAGGNHVTFAVSGTIEVSGEIDVESNTTIDGVGRDVTILGMFDIHGVQNVIVRNLTFTGSDDDSIRVIRSHTMWFDHLDMSDSADGLIDITEGSTDATISWSHFHDHDKMVLINPRVDSGIRARVTLHHNWFDNGGRRYPSAETSDIHGFNNFYDGWSNYGVLITEGSRFVSEGNVYAESGNKGGLVTNFQDEAPGAAVSTGDLTIGNVDLQVQGVAFVPPYSYTVDSASSVVASVKAWSGPNP
jgi:pectate lyase